MRRRSGQLTPLEASIIEAALDLRRASMREFYGFVLAKQMKANAGARFRTAYGTLYKTLDRMEKAGWLRSRWEDPAIAEAESRPRRRFYELTPEGERAYQRAAVTMTARLSPSGGTS
jgi:DNA-binding PadR family transcriptional regulator